jgi:hypothetical protein
MDEYCSYYAVFLWGDSSKNSFNLREEAKNLKNNQCIGPFTCKGCGAEIILEKNKKGEINVINETYGDVRVPLGEFELTCRIITRTIVNQN